MSNLMTMNGAKRYLRGMSRPATAIPPMKLSARHVARDFGWFWEITEDVDFLTTELSRLGRGLYV